MKQLTDLGFGGMPICMAKTQYSFSDDQNLLGAPEDFTVTVRNIKVSAGAGFLVALTGDIMTMPGLPKAPRGGKDRRGREREDHRPVLRRHGHARRRRAAANAAYKRFGVSQNLGAGGLCLPALIRMRGPRGACPVGCPCPACPRRPRRKRSTWTRTGRSPACSETAWSCPPTAGRRKCGVQAFWREPKPWSGRALPARSDSDAGSPRGLPRGVPMSGLPKVPAAEKIDVDENGKITGLF